MKLTVAQLQKALNIRIKIEKQEAVIAQLHKQLEEIMNEKNVKPNVPVGRKVKTQRKGGHIRSKRGSLKKLVVKVLESAGRPLRIDEIYKGLKKIGYKTTSKNPMRQLSTRLYSDKELARPERGTFTLKS